MQAMPQALEAIIELETPREKVTANIIHGNPDGTLSMIMWAAIETCAPLSMLGSTRTWLTITSKIGGTRTTLIGMTSKTARPVGGTQGMFGKERP
jgi:hypothetical protein